MSSLVYFPLDEFLSKGHLNEEGFYFLQIRHELMSQYSKEPTRLGFFVREWIERCDLGEVKYSPSPKDPREIFFLIFTSKMDREAIIDLLTNDKQFLFCAEPHANSLHFNGNSMLRYISKAEDGYYLSSAHPKAKSVDEYELFCWLRRNIQTTIFSHEGNFFFTNRDDEMRFKLRWANVPAE